MTDVLHPRRARALLLPLFIGILAWPGQRTATGDGEAGARLTYPKARLDDIVESHHGIAVKDPYRWMEDLESEETTRWVEEQDELLKSYVRAVPDREAIRRRILELAGGERFLSPVKAGGRYFLTRIASNGAVTGLWIQDGAMAEPRRLLDPKARFPGKDVVLSGFSPSPDGRFVAYTVSQGQSRWLDIRILETASGADRATVSLQTNSVSSGLAWTPDGKGFFFTHFDRPAGVSDDKATPIHPTIRFYGLAEARDTLAFEPPAEPGLLVGYTLSDDGRYLVLTLRDGSSSKNRVLYQDLGAPGGRATPLLPVADANYTFLGSEGTLFWFFTDRDAPRGRVIAVDITKPQRRNWREVVPQAGETIAANSAVGGNALGMFAKRFVLMYLRDGRPILRVFDVRGRLLFEPGLPPGGLIWGGFSGSPRDPEVFYRFLSLTDVSTVYRLDVEKKQNSVFHRAENPFDSAGIVVRQVFYRGKDGTRIPMFLAHRKGLKRDGRSPAYMYGYGAFGWVSFLFYQPFVLNWLELGGVYAQPSIRGGGEYGESWHEAGAKRNKQTAIDDYLAAAAWLVANGYTSSSRLVANGGSASGGLAGAAILQRPDLFGAAVIDRPILDMVRFDRFNQASYWLPEFGSPGDPGDFRALYAWSPYHNVKSGHCYPATLVMSGDRDQVTVPLHAYKFTAAMQAAQGCDKPVLLKVMWGAGHNFGTTAEQSADSWADETAFLVRALSIESSGRSGTKE
jgi:prolyl oligopeptidase